MSEPAIFVFVRDGVKKRFADRWAGAFLTRELMWGPEALEQWVSQFDVLENDDEDVHDYDSPVIVDYDNRTLTWPGRDSESGAPAVEHVFGQVIVKAWPGFEIITFDYDDAGDSDYDPLEDRHETIADASLLDEHDDEEDEDSPFGESPRAWITIVDKKNKIRHRQLESLSQDIFSPGNDLARKLAALPPAEIPKELLVNEGLWIDIANRKIGVWGGSKLKKLLPRLSTGWRNWNVEWAEGGYQQHCEATQSAGERLDPAEALVEFVPQSLSTQRFDLSSMIGAIGGGLKNTAMKATGCLLFLICLPLLIFGFFSGQWMAVGITILVTIIVVVIIFKVIEGRIKKGFNQNLSKHQPSEEPKGPPTAGPMDEDERKSIMDSYLSQSGLPSIDELKSRFPDKFDLEL